jgi:hypothetical protein
MPHDENDPDREELSLLRGLRSDHPAPVSVEARVMQRLVISLPAAAAAPRASVTSTHPAAPLLQKGAIVVAHPWAWALGFTVAGAVAGGALHATLAPEKVRAVYVDRTASDASRAPTSHGSVQGNAIALSPTEGHAPAPASSQEALPPAARNDTRDDSLPSPLDSASSADHRSALARERALLDTARRAIAADDHAACLTELRKHARSFSAGKLAEERDAMVVNALVGTGQYDEARQKAALFAKRYPNSFLAPSVEGAILAIPAQ